MSKDWTERELQQASRVMKSMGHMTYEEFCEELERGGFTEKEHKSERKETSVMVNKNDGTRAE